MIIQNKFVRDKYGKFLKNMEHLTPRIRERAPQERFLLKTGGRAWGTHNVNENYTFPDSPHDGGLDPAIVEDTERF